MERTKHIIIQKKCHACKKIKAIADFGKNNQNKDGIHNYCKDCANKKQQLFNKRNPRYYNKYVYKWNKINPEKRHEQH